MLLTLQKISTNTLLHFFILCYAFVLPLSRAGIGLLSAILLLFFLLDKNLKQNVQSLWENKVFKALLLFLLYFTLSLLWSSDLEQGFKILVRYWYLLPLILFITHIKQAYIPQIISAFLAGMLLSEVLSYGIFFELWTWKHGTPMNPTPFMNHLQYSMFLTFTSLLLLNRFFFESELKWKIFYFLYFLVVTSNLFINGGRTGHLAFALSIFVVGFINMKNKLFAFFSMLILVSTIFYTAYHVSPVFKHRFIQTQQESNILISDSANKYNGSFGLRLGSWIVGFEIFKENPLFGVGHGASMYELQEKIDADMLEYKSVFNMVNFHNSYINYLVEGGILGLVLYLALFYFIFTLKIKNREIKNLSYIFISVFSIASMVEQMFIAQFPLALFALFVGIFVAASKQKESKNETSI